VLAADGVREVPFYEAHACCQRHVVEVIDLGDMF
jgi:hypothetical protein